MFELVGEEVVRCFGQDFFQNDFVRRMGEVFQIEVGKEFFQSREGFAFVPVFSSVIGAGILAGIAADGPGGCIFFRHILRISSAAEGIAEGYTAEGVHGVGGFQCMGGAGFPAESAVFAAGAEGFLMVKPAFCIYGKSVKLYEGACFIIEEIILTNDSKPCHDRCVAKAANLSMIVISSVIPADAFFFQPFPERELFLEKFSVRIAVWGKEEGFGIFLPKVGRIPEPGKACGTDDEGFRPGETFPYVGQREKMALERY